MTMRSRALVAWVTAATVEAALAQAPATPRATVLDFSGETPGAEPRTMVPVVGTWGIADDAGNRVLVIDGRKWQRGQTSANLAEKARSLYGDRYAEFLDSVQAFAFFPYAVAQGVNVFREGDVSLRFKALSGRIDQAAGILFDLRNNGDYLALRANPLENNLVLWQFLRGKRSSVKWVRNTPTPSRQWLTLRLRVAGRKVEGYLEGKLLLEHTLPNPVSGRVGVWSKADSYVYVDDYRVEPARSPVR